MAIENTQNNGFKHPSELEEMSVEQALDFLNLVREGHGEIFNSPYEYLKTLIIKCKVDPKFVLEHGSYLDLTAEELNAHLLQEKMPLEEAKKYIEEIEKKVEEKNAEKKHDNMYKELKKEYDKKNLFGKLKAKIDGKDLSKYNNPDITNEELEARLNEMGIEVDEYGHGRRF